LIDYTIVFCRCTTQYHILVIRLQKFVMFAQKERFNFVYKILDIVVQRLYNRSRK
jgi:hypothetical protein